MTVTAAGGAPIVTMPTARSFDTPIATADFHDLLINSWVAGLEQPTTGYAIRPPRAQETGYEWAVSNAGVSADVPPAWPTGPGAIWYDGTVTWTSQALSSASLIDTFTAVTWTAAIPSGPTITPEAVAGEIGKAVIGSLTSGQQYTFTCQMTTTTLSLKYEIGFILPVQD